MRNEGQGAIDYGSDYKKDADFTIDPDTKKVVRCQTQNEIKEEREKINLKRLQDIAQWKERHQDKWF